MGEQKKKHKQRPRFSRRPRETRPLFCDLRRIRISGSPGRGPGQLGQQREGLGPVGARRETRQHRVHLTSEPVRARDARGKRAPSITEAGLPGGNMPSWNIKDVKTWLGTF